MSEYFAKLITFSMRKIPGPIPQKTLVDQSLECQYADRRRKAVGAKSGAVWSATYARRQQPSNLGWRVAEESAASEWGRSGQGFSFFLLHVWVNTHGSQRRRRWIVCDNKSPRLNGNPNFLCPSSMSFISTMNIKPANHRVQIWHFSGFIYNI